MMAAKFDNMTEAVTRGRVAPLTRLDKGVPRTLKLLPLLARNARDVPLWFLVLKAAWESAGNPGAISASGKDVGLFQLIVKPGQTLQGYTYEQIKDPAINTQLFARRVNAWRQSLFQDHAAWFPEGPNSDSVWGILWLFGAIGSHATRYLMGVIGPGPDTFNRIVDFALTMPNWFAGGDQRQHWGAQSPELVVFRILISARVMQYGEAVKVRVRELTGTLPLAFSAQVSRQVGIGVGAVVLAAALGGVTYYSIRDRQRYREGWNQLVERLR